MSTTPVVIQGTLKPDGTLELDAKLTLPAGRVQVTVQPVAEPARAREDWWQYLQRARAELEAIGPSFRTAEDIETEREDFRSGEERLEDIYRQRKDAPSSGERPEC
jgi:hypothetical protein